MLLGIRARLMTLVNDFTRKCLAIKVARALGERLTTSIFSLGYRGRTAAVKPSTANSGTNASMARYFTVSRKRKRPLRCIASTATPKMSAVVAGLQARDSVYNRSKSAIFRGCKHTTVSFCVWYKISGRSVWLMALSELG